MNDQQPQQQLLGLEDVRAKVRDRLSAALGDPDMSVRLERSIYNSVLERCEADGTPMYWESRRFRQQLKQHALHVEQNLTNASNPRLRERLMRGDLKPRDLARMTNEQMFPELYEEVHARLKSSELRKMAPTTRPEDAPDGAYTCRKCKSKKTTFKSLQIRSADEPMTNFVYCLSCGKSWKD